MFSKIAHHSRSVLQQAPRLPLSCARAFVMSWKPQAVSAARVVPHPGVAIAGLSRNLSVATTGRSDSRDWPGMDGEGEAQRWSADAERVRQACLAGRGNRMASLARAYPCADQMGSGLATLTTQACMHMGLATLREELLEREAPGVVEGLRQLAIAPGDLVIDQDPAQPSLAVRLALEGIRTVVTLSSEARLQDVSDELVRYQSGRTAGLRRLRLDLHPSAPEPDHADSARTVARHLRAVGGPDLSAVPREARYKAVLSRSAFDFMELRDIHRTLRDAGRLLQAGGGLVFEFSHAAGWSEPAEPDGSQQRCIDFSQIAQAVQRAGLDLRHLHVAFRFVDNPSRAVIPARRVRPDRSGVIDLRLADAAARSGWEEIARQSSVAGRPVRISASGLFVKQGPTKG